jgi:Flp pilus assembly protein TadG
MLNFLRQERGAAILESTLSLMVLLMAIFSVMDLSRILYFDHYVSYTAREAARYAMVRGATWNNAACATTSTTGCTATSTDISNYVQSITPIGNNGNLSVHTTWPGTTPAGSRCNTTTNSPGCTVAVQVSYNFNFVVPLLPHNTVLLSSTASLPIAE